MGEFVEGLEAGAAGGIESCQAHSTQKVIQANQ